MLAEENYLDPEEKWSEIKKKIEEIRKMLSDPVLWCEVYGEKMCQGCPITMFDSPCSSAASLFSRLVRDFNDFEQDVKMMKLLIEKAKEMEVN